MWFQIHYKWMFGSKWIPTERMHSRIGSQINRSQMNEDPKRYSNGLGSKWMNEFDPKFQSNPTWMSKLSHFSISIFIAHSDLIRHYSTDVTVQIVRRNGRPSSSSCGRLTVRMKHFGRYDFVLLFGCAPYSFDLSVGPKTNRHEKGGY